MSKSKRDLVAGSILLAMTLLTVILYPNPYSPFSIPVALFTCIMVIALLRRPVWALYLAIFVVLLPDGILPADLQSLLNRGTTVMAFFSWLYSLLREGSQRIWSTTSIIMLIFLLWSTVTIVWAEHPESTMLLLSVYTMRLALFLILVPALTRTWQDLNQLMAVVAACGWSLIIVSAAYVVVQGYIPGTRLKIYGINENDLGMTALILIPGVLWQAGRMKSRILGTLTSALFLFSTTAIIAMSGSQGCFISLLITVLALFCFKHSRPWGKLALSLPILAMLFFPTIFVTTFERLSSSIEERSLGDRVALWDQGLNLIEQHPLGGVGIGNSSFHVRPAFEIEGSSGAPIHNPVIVLWGETGIIGLILYIGILLSAIWSFFTQYRYCLRQNIRWLLPYFALIGSAGLGYLASWIKAGGGETDRAYFFLIALMLIPSSIRLRGWSEQKIQIRQSIGSVPCHEN